MKILLDMNLSPAWTSFLKDAGWEATHWSTVGDPRAPDVVLMAWAREHGYVVFTHDLDFGTMLALTRAPGPSVIQIRCEDITPSGSGALVVRALRQFGETLERGALVVVDEARLRARVLPFDI